MGTVWPLQKARNRLSQVVDAAIAQGPQVISRRGEPVAVIVGMEDYQRLTRRAESLVRFFQRSPLCGVDLDLTRSRDTGRAAPL